MLLLPGAPRLAPHAGPGQGPGFRRPSRVAVSSVCVCFPRINTKKENNKIFTCSYYRLIVTDYCCAWVAIG